MKNSLLFFVFVSLLQCNVFAMESLESDLRDEPARMAQRTPRELGCELLSAAYTGNVANVQKLIEEGVDVNNYGDNHRTALMMAAVMGHIEVVDLLYKHGAYVNVRDTSRLTPLKGAIKYGHAEIVDTLLQHGAYVNPPFYGESSLIVSINTQNPNRLIVETLLYAGASLCDLNQASMATLKSILPEEEHQQLIEKIIADPNCVRIPKKFYKRSLVRFAQQRELGMKK